MAKDQPNDQEICEICEQELCQCSVGEKRACPVCETRFYDLNPRSKKPKCPECGEIYIRDDANVELKTKYELEAEGGAITNSVPNDYEPNEMDDTSKDDDESDVDEEADEESDIDVIPATDEVELKIEDDDEEEGSAKTRKNFDVNLGDDLDEDMMDDDNDDEDDIELDGTGSVPK